MWTASVLARARSRVTLGTLWLSSLSGVLACWLLSDFLRKDFLLSLCVLGLFMSVCYSCGGSV